MNKLLLESMQNYLDETIPEEKDVNLLQVVILGRMNLRLQIELYNEALDKMRGIFDTMFSMAQNMEAIKKQLSHIEKRGESLK